MADFSVVRQRIGTRGPIGNSGFSVASQLSGTEVRKEDRILCVSPHDRHIAYLLLIVYTEDTKYAISLFDFNECLYCLYWL